MKKLLLLTTLFILASNALLGQDLRPIKASVANQPEVTTSLPQLLSDFDLSQVPTGFLLEAGFELLDLTTVNGDSSKAYKADPLSLGLIYESIKSMDVSGNRIWNSPPQIDSLTNAVSVGIALYSYNTLSENAFHQGLITYANGKLSPDGGASVADLYDTQKLVAISPLVLRAGHGPLTLTFNVLENSNLPYTSLAVDFNDGNGFRQITDGASVAYTPTSTDPLELTLRVTFLEGCCYAQSYISILEEPVCTPHISSTAFADRISFQTNKGDTIEAIISFAAAERPNPQHQALIVVEGFDPIKLLENNNSFGFTSIFDIVNSIVVTFKGFDIYYVDWINSEADIRDNAKLLKLVLERINTLRHYNGSPARSVMLAQSMGGLIAQIALREMEIDGIPHEVDHVFFDDVPFKGVNVPVGAVYAYQSLYNYANSTLPGVIAGIAYRNSLDVIHRYLYGKSAQQMAVNYINPNGNVDHSAFSQLQQRLFTLGMPKGDVGFPIRTYAISNGGRPLSYAETLTHTDGKLLKATIHGNLNNLWDVLLRPLLGPLFSFTNLFNDDAGANILSYLPGFSNLHYELSVAPNNNYNDVLSRFTGTYSNRILGLINISSTFIDDIKTPSASITSLDYGHTSVYEIPLAEQNNQTWIDSTAYFYNGMLYEAAARLQLSKQIAFVPTYSSLNVNGSVSRDYYSSPIGGNGTSFDGYHLPDGNESQNHITNVPWDWMSEQISMASLEIAAPDTVHVGDVLTLPGVVGPITWTCSPDNLVSIDSRTGKITNIRDNTTALITAYQYRRGSLFARRKYVAAMLPVCPVLYLESGADENGTYVQLKSPDPDYEDYLDDPDTPAQITWYYKKDSYALMMNAGDRRRFYIQEHIETTDDWLRITAHVQDPLNPRPTSEQYLGFDIWCCQRVKLIAPTSILCSGNEIQFEHSPWDPDLSPFYPPMLFIRDNSFPPRYADIHITPKLTLVVDDDLSFPANEINNSWVFPIFDSDDVIDRINEILDNLDSPGVGFLRMSMVNSLGNPIKDLVFPIIKIQEP